MFPGNEIAKNYRCARTKTRAIVSEFASTYKQELIENLKQQPFCLSTDGTNDTDSKLYPMVVNHFNIKEKKIQNALLAVPILENDATGLNIASLMMTKMEQFGIPMKNCVAFRADNAPVMIGNKSGVYAILKQSQSNLILIGCLCHRINLVAEKGAACLPLNIDDLLVDIFYYLDKSAKRKDKLKSFQELHSEETKKILKHVATRWLSTTKCLERLLSLWDALVIFFKSEIESSKKKVSQSLEFYKIPLKENDVDDGPSTSKGFSKKRLGNFGVTKESKKICRSSLSVLARDERIFYLLTDDVNKAYCLFIMYINPMFDKLNILLQSESPQIYRLRTLLVGLLKEVLSKFVKVSLFKNCKDILKINYGTPNQRNNEEILVGEKTKAIIQLLKPQEKEDFFKHVRHFYVKVCDYMINKFPFTDPVLIHAEVCSVEKFETASFSSIKYFFDKFTMFLEIDIVQSEIYKLQIDGIPEEIKMKERIDEQWVLIGEIKNEMNETPYKNLANVMLGILCIPHSNAEYERIFSKVKKNRTAFRSQLSDESIEELLIMKDNFFGKCYDIELSREFLKKAKCATVSASK